jgi:hypothetical protein
MSVAYIKLDYRQVIDIAASSGFEKAILQASYQEFLLKSQVYNPDGKWKTFTELKSQDGRANSLHYKCSFAVVGIINTLKKQIPFLTDTLEQPIAFDTFRFELVESNITDKSMHKVAIHYITDTCTLYGSIDDCMILSKSDKFNTVTSGSEETFMLQLRSNLSICSYEPVVMQAHS